MSLNYLPMVANSSELLGLISSKLRMQARVKKFYILKLLTHWIKRFLSSYKCYCDWNEVRNLVAGKRNKTGTISTIGNKWLLALREKKWYEVVSTSSWDNELSSVNQRRNKIEQTINFIWFHTIIPTLMIFRCMKAHEVSVQSVAKVQSSYLIKSPIKLCQHQCKQISLPRANCIRFYGMSKDQNVGFQVHLF